jgi:pantetheine-phosphate adenylyltransferase
MKPTFVYSGTFDPPTYGHLALLNEAVKTFPGIIVVCSDHSRLPTKFSLDERVSLWKTYPLPTGVTIETFEDFLKRDIPGKDIVLIRGLRSEADGEHEARVLLSSAQNAGVTKTFTLVAPEATATISSSQVWILAKNNDDRDLLSTMVSPDILQEVLHKGSQSVK